jgi:hypothetical protein
VLQLLIHGHQQRFNDAPPVGAVPVESQGINADGVQADEGGDVVAKLPVASLCQLRVWGCPALTDRADGSVRLAA